MGKRRCWSRMVATGNFIFTFFFLNFQNSKKKFFLEFQIFFNKKMFLSNSQIFFRIFQIRLRKKIIFRKIGLFGIKF